MPKERPWFCDWVRCCSWSVYFHGYSTYSMKFQGRGVTYLCETHGFISFICGWINLTTSCCFAWASTGLGGPYCASLGSYMDKNFSQLKQQIIFCWTPSIRKCKNNHHPLCRGGEWWRSIVPFGNSPHLGSLSSIINLYPKEQLLCEVIFCQEGVYLLLKKNKLNPMSIWNSGLLD